MVTKLGRLLIFGSIALFLSGCSSYSGLRTPKYDGEPFVPEQEKIVAFEKGREIIGEEQEHYLPEPFSTAILDPTLDYVAHEPMILEEGTYTVGEDIPTSRVTIMGEKEDPELSIENFVDPAAPSKPDEYRVGTMTIHDPEGQLYFENMFHPYYGVQIIQVDLIEGHTIEINGHFPELVIFFEEFLPSDPYIFDTRWEEYLAELEQEGYERVEMPEQIEIPGESAEDESDYFKHQPLKIIDPGKTLELKAGIYEVGVHFEAGTYEVTEQSSPTHTELFLFRQGEEPRIFDMSKNLYGLFHRHGFMNMDNSDGIKATFELQPGDKIYPHYVDYMLLTKID